MGKIIPAEDQKWDAEKAQKAWRETRGVKESRGHLCITRLLGRRCQIGRFYGEAMEHQCLPPGADHYSLWIDKKTKRPEIFVSQPYHFYEITAERTVEFCKKFGLKFTIKTWPAWHYPGHVLFIEYRKAD